MKKSSAVLVLFYLIALSVNAQLDLNKTFTGVKSIKMSTSSGNCVMSKSDDASISVVLKSTFGKDSGYDPQIEQSGDLLIIKETFHGRSSNGSAQWTIRVPNGIRIGYRTGSGDADISGLNTDMDISSGSGNMEFSSVKGDINGSTGSGNITFDAFDGTASLNTGSGNIKGSKSQGKIRVNCGSGDITFAHCTAAFTANTGSGNIRGQITLTGDSRFNTGSGDAELSLGATPAVNISMACGSGNAILDFNGNEIAGKITMKASKRHGTIIAPFDFDKTEEVTNDGDNNITLVKTVVRGKGANEINISTGSGNAEIKK